MLQNASLSCVLVLLLFFVSTGLSSVADGAVIYVPDDQPTIQDAITFADHGDTIVVRSGTYVETIDFEGKQLVVRSESGPETTTIDGNQNGSVVTFQSGEGPDSILEGFSVTNGYGDHYPDYSGGGVCCKSSSPTLIGNTITGNVSFYGGGIYCEQSAPNLLHNTITGNEAYFGGGGINCEDSSPLIAHNRITGNSATDGYGAGIRCELSDAVIAFNVIDGNELLQCADLGGGIYLAQSNPTITGNIISRNSANYGYGGGIYCRDSSPMISNNVVFSNITLREGGGIYCKESHATIVNNTICGNSVSHNGGGISCSGGSTTIVNTILWNNTAPDDPQIYGTGLSVTCSDVEGGWPGTGNIDADPLFVDPGEADFHLTLGSPCTNSGDNGSVPPDLVADFEDDPRIALDVVDMGADEFYYHLYHGGDVVPGGDVRINVVGCPFLRVVLILGSGVQDPPYETQHGAFHLQWPPVWWAEIGTIPSSGVLVHSATVPAGWYPGERHPLQALAGPWGGPFTQFTNLMVLSVE